MTSLTGSRPIEGVSRSKHQDSACWFTSSFDLAVFDACLLTICCTRSSEDRSSERSRPEKNQGTAEQDALVWPCSHSWGPAALTAAANTKRNYGNPFAGLSNNKTATDSWLPVALVIKKIVRPSPSDDRVLRTVCDDGRYLDSTLRASIVRFCLSRPITPWGMALPAAQ